MSFLVVLLAKQMTLVYLSNDLPGPSISNP